MKELRRTPCAECQQLGRLLVALLVLAAAGCGPSAGAAIQSTETVPTFLDARDSETLLLQIAYDEIARDGAALRRDCRNGIRTIVQWRARAMLVTPKVRGSLIAAYDDEHYGFALCSRGNYSPLTATHLGRALTHLFDAMDAIHGLGPI